ncbi:MAG: hypothetical protein ACXVH7_13145, partial [Thermoanaerobaculia bacterium]
MSSVSTPGTRERMKASGWGAVILWAFAVMWNGAVLTMTLVVYLREPANTAALAVIGVFALAGLFLLAIAIKATSNAARFRGTELELQSSPGVLGGKLTGVMHLPQRVLRAGPLQFRVSSWRREDDSPDELLWEMVEPAGQPRITGAETAVLPFSIRLPFDCEATGSSGGNRFYWDLMLRRESGKGFVRFEVPVARTSESSEAQTRIALRPVTSREPARTTARLHPSADGVEVVLPLPTWFWKWYGFFAIVTPLALFLTREFVGEPRLLYLGISGVALFFLLFPLVSLSLTVRRVRANRSGVEIAYTFPVRRPVIVKREELADIEASYSGSAMKYFVRFIRVDGGEMTGSLLYADTK